jgi:hypothetical protein
MARALLIVGCVLAGASLSACDSDDPVQPAANALGTSTVGRGSGATIEGIPPATAVAGQLYTFAPQVTDSTATTTFSVKNLPSWAKFSASSGEIYGTPSASQIGTFSNIVITMTDAGVATSLPAFTITVEATGGADNVMLSWQAPTQNADGSPLVNLQGYQIHYGTEPNTYTESVKIANPGLTDYVVQNLAPGKYYFALTAYNSAGAESALSGEVSTVVN